MSAPLEATTTRDATLRFLLREGGSSASRLAACMRISVQAMRRHLRSLENDGLVESNLLSEGPGRPSNFWQLTPQGQNCFNNGDGSEKFALDLLSAIESNLSEQRVIQILKKQTVQKAITYQKKIGKGSLNERLTKLIELRKQEGYLSELSLSSDGLGWYLNAFYCSIRSIAEKYPVVCDQELTLLREIFPDCHIERVQWRLESGHSCGFRVSQIKENG